MVNFFNLLASVAAVALLPHSNGSLVQICRLARPFLSAHSMSSVSPGSPASSHIQRREVSRLFYDLLSLRSTTIFSFVCGRFASLLWFILVIVVIFMPLVLLFSGVWWLGASLTQLLSVFCLFSVILHFYCDFMILVVILWLFFASFFHHHFLAFLWLFAFSVLFRLVSVDHWIILHIKK